MKTVYLGVCALVCVFATQGYAQNTPKPPAPPAANFQAGIPIDMLQMRIEARFKRMDLNGDGELSAEEMSQSLDRGNRQADDQRDWQHRDATRGERRRNPDASGQQPRNRGNPNQSRGIMGMLHMNSLSDFDVNNDNKVTKAEFDAMTENLKKLDLNSDGNLDRTELAAMATGSQGPQ